MDTKTRDYQEIVWGITRMDLRTRFICGTCQAAGTAPSSHTFLTAAALVGHVLAEGMCRACGFRHDDGDCPRWPAS